MLKNTIRNSPTLCFWILMLIAACLITVQIFTKNTLTAASAACILSFFIALLCGAGTKTIVESVTQVLRRSAGAVLILAMISFVCGIWLKGGMLATMLYWTAKINVPKFSLLLAFAACSAMAYITGSSFSTISSMGVVTVLIAVSSGMNKSVAVGAAVSGAILGNKYSSVSDTVNLASALCSIEVKAHRRAMRKRTMLAGIISAFMYLLIGLISGTDTGTNPSLKICAVLEQSFQITPLAVLPLVVLILLTYTKLSTLQNLLICTAVSLVAAVYTQQIPFSEALAAGFLGFQTLENAAPIIQSLAGSGLVSSVKTLLIICLTSALGGLLTASSITPVLFGKIKEKTTGYDTLRLACLALSAGILCITGNQILAIILMAPEFLPLFEKREGGKQELAGIFADTTVVMGPLLPWSVTTMFVSQVFSLTNCSYMFFCFFCTTTVILAFARILTGRIKQQRKP